MHKIVPLKIAPILEEIRTAGGRSYIVGGAVRDTLMGLDTATKDLDFEIYDLALDDLLSLLKRFGTVDVVGRSFGVIKLWIKQAGELDFSLPRRESKTGAGHRGFIASPDPAMSPEEACARRDFTLNAILMDPFDGTLLDFFGGKEDLRNKVLRHTSDHFYEDPLRPLRAVQLAARFDLRMHPDTAALCADMASDAGALASERIYGEWEKWALRAACPSRGLYTLRDIGWLPVFPALQELSKQAARFEETAARVDRAGASAADLNLCPDDSVVLLLAALCRDLEAESLLSSIGAPNRLSKRIVPLVREVRAFRDTGFPTDSELLHAASRLAPESFGMLSRVAAADTETGEAVPELLARAARLGVDEGPPKPLLLGRDLNALGFAPGPDMGRLLKEAFESQLSGTLKNKEQALAWAASRKPPQ